MIVRLICLFAFLFVPHSFAQNALKASNVVLAKPSEVKSQGEEIQLQRDLLDVERERLQLERKQFNEALNVSAEKVRTEWFDKGLDIVKTIFATFLGAFLGFYFGLRQQKLQRLADQKAAGNMAMVVLKRQFRDFTIYMSSISDSRNKHMKLLPAAPVWTQQRPSMFTFTESLRFYFKSLAFLVDDGKTNVFDLLVDAEICYHELASMKEHLNEALQRIQKQLSNVVADANSDWNAIERVQLGSELAGKANSFIHAIENREKKDGEIYLKAAETLHSLLVERFGGNGIFPIPEPPKSKPATT